MRFPNLVLIGEGGVLVRCGETLLSAGHRIRTVVTGDAAVRAWAVKAGIRHCDLDDAVIDPAELSCDVLLSIGNHRVIPSALLACAERASVNYHYGPLPQYAGLNAPSWAVSNSESDYAITWHRIGELVDGGDILKRVPVPVEPDETGLSLGVKCDEAAVTSVAELIDDIAHGRATAVPQNLAERRYFSRHAQFPAEGLIDWTRDAKEIVAMVRATDHGLYGSPLVWPKLNIGGRIVGVREAHVGAAPPGAMTGLVLSCDANGLVVAANGAVHLTRICTLEGESIEIDRLPAESSARPGFILSSPNEVLRDSITDAGIQASKGSRLWRERLGTDAHRLRLPFTRPSSPVIEDAPPVMARCVAPGGISGLVGAVSTYLSRAAATDEVVLAVKAPRDDIHIDYRDLFTAWLPLRASVDPSRTIADNLMTVDEEFRLGQATGLLRRDQIGRDETLRRLWEAGDLMPDVMISWGRTADPADHRPPLNLVVQPDGETVEFVFDDRRLSRRDVARFAAQLSDWCDRIPGLANEALSSVDVLSKSERVSLMHTFNDTNAAAFLGHRLHVLFEQAAERYADNVALICDDTSLTYSQLNARANAGACILLERGIGCGDLVGIALDRSLDLVETILAVLKTGAAYVPIDPTFPVERLRQMMEDADPTLVLTPPEVPSNLAEWSNRCLSFADVAGDHPNGSTTNPGIDVEVGDLAYVIYTSGSTGRPKGVEISHSALCNLLESMCAEPGCVETDRLLAVTTISFDIAVLELFVPLLSGAATVIALAHEAVDAKALVGLMERHEITMMQGTPATWHLLLESGWYGHPHLDKILCGGEALPRKLANRLLSCGDTVWNMYGPTETTVWSSLWRVTPEGNVLIGHPIANTQLYVLDENLSPVPLGFVGELCIGGEGVARGYHDAPDLTDARFVPSPFQPGSMYRTGDLARFVEPGALSVLGRNDSQLKIRGHRIELGDIEATLTSNDDIARAVVVSRNGQLVAYCIRDVSAPAEAPRDEQAQRVALAEWASAWDSAYEADVDDAEFNLAGWRNSYDGSPFPAAEMRDWQRSSVDRILSYAPQRVFEIGSGTGLMMFGIAPHCAEYHAVDSSAQAIEVTSRHLQSLPHVTCEHRPAHDLPEVAAGVFDTVIINSVAQYFPNVDYLTSVLEWATTAVSEGRVFLGDIRDLSLLREFHTDVINFRHSDLSPGEVGRRVERAVRSERELVVAPDYFANLPSLFPQITGVDVALRNGRYVNEMTRFRYDVTLHIGGTPDVQLPAAERNWRTEELDIAAVSILLGAIGGKSLRLSDIPNGRLTAVQDGLAARGEAIEPTGPGVDPRDLAEIAREAGMEIALLPSRSGDKWAFDAVLWRPGVTPDLRLRPAEAIDRAALARLANVPVAGAPARKPLDRVLRPWLAERLPAYMVPAFFVELEDFPLTPNGKIDRKGLPDPLAGAETISKPANRLEQDILAAWSEVLGHDRIGVNQNFFEIGGDSLRVVRVQSRLEKVLGRSVPAAKLFEHFTVKALAAYLAGSPATNGRVLTKSSRRSDEEPIAIIGMACRLPGDVSSPEELWDLLERGADGIIEVPSDRWDADAIYDPDPDARGKSVTRRGGFLATPIDMFDASFFGIAPREAHAMDPLQRLMLETTWEAFERAGYTTEQLRGSETGTYIGVGKNSSYQEYGITTGGSVADLDGYVGTGSALATASGRISHVFGLEGPTMTIDTACSSSLVTSHLAANALRNGECDLAVSGGATILLTSNMSVEFSRLRGMSPDGLCRSFSADNDGTGWSEGVAVVILKRLSDAQRDGDVIHAVLRGTAVNHDGHAASLTTPSGPAQQKVIHSALCASGLQPEDIDYLEAHGTGTRLGDPIEGTALAEVFGGSHPDAPLWVGSVKSNLSHTQAAAGLAGVMKIVLSLRHNKIPRTLHVSEASPAVDWAGANMALVLEPQPWLPKGRPRRGGVSSFGIGGTNAHVIVEEPPAFERLAKSMAPAPRTLPFVVSGFNDASLRDQADELHQHMGMNIQDRLLDVAYSLATTRSHFRKRLVVVAEDKSDLLDKLGSFARSGETPLGATRTGDRPEQQRLALLITGQGSQVTGMGKDLYDVYPTFRDALDETVAHFTELERPLLDVMWADPDTPDAALLHRTDFTQPALFALEVALGRLWQSWGVLPDLLLGHSIGELAAAHIAGIFDLADACRLVAARGRLMQALPSTGAMASIEAAASEIEAAVDALKLSGKVDLAGLNTPTQTVVSGDADAVQALVERFGSEGRRVKELTVSHAFHSHHMDAMLPDFRAVVETVTFRPPTIDLVSSLTGAMAEPGELEQADYWVRQVRGTVRFSDGIATLKREGTNIFLELGPQPVLSGMGAACLADETDIAWVPSLVAGKDGSAVIQRSLADLHVQGVSIDWRAWFSPFGGEKVALPTYAFQRERFWFEPSTLRSVGSGLDDTGHPLLGSGVHIAGTDTAAFITVVAPGEPAWVNDHQILGTVLMPGTAYMEAMRAAADATEDGEWDVADVDFLYPMVFAGGAPARMQVTVGSEFEGSRPVQVYSAPDSEDGEWLLHAEGKIVPAEKLAAGAVTLPPPGAERLDVSELYTDLDTVGYEFGPLFKGVREAWQQDGVVWVRAALPEDAVDTAASYVLHPALMDSAMQSLLFSMRMQDTNPEDVLVPFEAERLTIREKGLSEIWVRVAEFKLGEGEFYASLDFFNAAGENVGRLEQMHARRVDRAVLRRLVAAGVDRFQFEVNWKPVDIDKVEIGGSWGLLAPGGEVPWAAAVKTALNRAGVQSFKVRDLSEAEALDGVICLWDAGKDVLDGAHTLSAAALRQLQAVTESGFAPPLVWLTRCGVGISSDDLAHGLGAGPLWGLMRTARSENPGLALRLVDLGDEEADVAALAPALMLAEAPESVLRQGKVFLSHLERAGASGELTLPTDGSWQLEIGARGLLDQPLTVRRVTPKALATGMIRAEVKAAGVNFLDVLNALGMVELPVFGMEFSGVVTEVGANVKGVEVGDRVLGLGQGSFAAEVVTDARWVVRVPENLTFEEAATIPMAFLSAWFGLYDLGALEQGELVLIHAAAGGVGMAAVQLAKLRGAEVYGTASEAKWEALREMGLDDDHIASSRDLGFVESFGRTAPGRSFGVVLNSLADEFIDASLGMLASGGRFLELGKIDLREQTWVDENYPGVKYRVYHLLEANPDEMQAMLVSLAELFAEGKLKPLPLRTFPITATSDALRFMAQARHVGKVVLVPTKQKEFIQSGGSVLITGGVGGLGRHVATWLANVHGVRDLVLTSRRGPDSPGADELVAELAEIGTTATVVAADSADLESMTSVMALFGGERPLRGVVHAAGVLDDGALSALTPERLDTVFSPKVDGAWHLHCLTQDLDLDFFLLFSSISNILGAPGQGNYAAANAFLDTLAHLRRAQGLAATSVAWGPWDGDGMAAKLSERDRVRISRTGLDGLSVQEGLELLEATVRSGRVMTVAAALDLTRIQAYYEEQGGVPPMLRSLLRTHGAGSRPKGDGGASLRKLLSQTDPAEHESVVLDMLREGVARTLGFTSMNDVDPDLPLQNLGIDSLTAVLMRNQLADMTGLALPAKIAFDHPDLKSLTRYLLERLQERGLDQLSEVETDSVASSGDSANVAGPDMAPVRKGYMDPTLRFDNCRGEMGRPGSVFLTGATGFVGAFLLHELLACGISTHCLVRADDAEAATQRLIGVLSGYDMWRDDFLPLLHPVVGDLAQPMFGLPEEVFDQLADDVDAVCHSGALVDWVRPLSEYIGPNVVGVHESLRLASRGRGKAVHVMSTFGTLPRYLGYEVTPDEMEYGYVTSKWMAEQMVIAARWRGAKASVYRLPFVGPSVDTGHFRLDRGDFLHNLVAGSMAMGGFPTTNASLGAVLPVDYLCRTITSIMLNERDRIGRDYDFVNAEAPTFNHFFELVTTVAGTGELLPFDEWKGQALDFAVANAGSALARIAALVDGLTPDNLTLTFGASLAGEHVLGGADYPAPPLDQQFVEKYVHRITAADEAASTMAGG